jgi:hypothetical protein
MPAVARDFDVSVAEGDLSQERPFRHAVCHNEELGQIPFPTAVRFPAELSNLQIQVFAGRDAGNLPGIIRAFRGYLGCVVIGNILSLEWFQAISNGKSRLL